MLLSCFFLLLVCSTTVLHNIMATKSKGYNYMHPLSLLKPSLFFLLLLWLLLVSFFFISNPHSPHNHSQTTVIQKSQCNTLKIAPFYIYTLPPQFNQALLQNCHSLNIYTNMCPHVANRGLGRPLNATWHATHQFITEMIFHARAENHPCRTFDVEKAEMFYVPFYGGLYASSVFRERDYGARDELGVKLVEFLIGSEIKSWKRMNGRDHFLVIGRTAWDFMRDDDDQGGDFGANKMFRLPPVINMSILTVERHPWQGHNQFGIPYPSYFHPFKASEMATWQDSVRRSNRTHLFSFVGGPRVDVEKAAVRNNISDQCARSDRCIRVQCEPGSVNCHEPDLVLEVMKRSEFCMQPPGDSFTRRSVFDSVLSGCVPVFFSEHTAYTQYEWYFSVKREEWSVFIEPDRWNCIEEELNRFSKDEVATMRDKVIEMIPQVTYVHPNASYSEFELDAVEIALVELTKKVRSLAPSYSQTL